MGSSPDPGDGGGRPPRDGNDDGDGDDDSDDALRPLLLALARAPEQSLTGGAPRLTAGTEVGRYRIVEHLGDGGMSVVYRALDRQLGREVALKLLHGHDAGADRRARFEREARALAALSHPSIVAIHDVGDHLGTPYLALELLEGETLRQRLRRGRLDVANALELSGQILAALAAAHDRGIVHRDLKPENLFLCRGGPLKVLDFGLAKRVVGLGSASISDEVPTLAGVVVGTAAYMAPEQLRVERVDERTDLFGFGAVLHEMLAGDRAFAAPTFVDTMHRILHDPPPRLDEQLAEVSPQLAAVVERCLAKRPADRFASAHEVADALAAATGPGASTMPRRAAAPVTRYARSGDVHIGYQTLGEGATALVVVPGFVSNIEQLWEDADTARLLNRLAERVRLVLFDKRGTGLSDRVIEPAAHVLEHRVDDIRVVMDHAGIDRAVLLGVSEGAPISVRFGVTYPERAAALVLYGGYAAFRASAAMVTMAAAVRDGWGTGGTLDLFGPSVAHDPAKRRWWARLERLAASPGAAAHHLEVLAHLDVSAVLGLVRMPTLVLHRMGDRVVPVTASRTLAAGIPGARLIEHPGDDHLIMLGDAESLGDDLLSFATAIDLAAPELADLDAPAVIRIAADDDAVPSLLRAIASAGGTVHDTGGAITASLPSTRLAIQVALGAAALAARAAIATARLPLTEAALAGLASAIRLAAPGEVVASAEVRGLAWGHGLGFEDRGIHPVDGDRGPAVRWFAVRALAAG